MTDIIEKHDDVKFIMDNKNMLLDIDYNNLQEIKDTVLNIEELINNNINALKQFPKLLNICKAYLINVQYKYCDCSDSSDEKKICEVIELVLELINKYNKSLDNLFN